MITKEKLENEIEESLELHYQGKIRTCLCNNCLKARDEECKRIKLQAIQDYEKEIQAFLEKKLVQKRKELEELDKIQDFDGAYILKIEIKLLESLEKEIKGE